MLVPEEQEVLRRTEPCGATVDIDTDGSVDATWVFEQELGGRREIGTEAAADGSLIMHYVYEVDRAGRPLLWYYELPGNGEGWYERNVSAYDTFGRLLRRERSQAEETRFTEDEVEVATSWNAAGRVLTSTVTYHDAEVGAGSYSYDEHGRLLAQRVVLAGGEVTFEKVSEYDDVARTRIDTRKARHSYYTTRRVWSFDHAGRAVRLEGSYLGAPGGLPTMVYEWVYAGDRLVREAGTVRDQAPETTTYTYCD